MLLLEVIFNPVGVVVAKTTGVNWNQIVAQVIVFGTAFGVVLTVGSKVWHAAMHDILQRLDGQDGAIKDIKEDAKEVKVAAALTNNSVARMEGYLAAQNGGGLTLPNVPTEVAVPSD